MVIITLLDLPLELPHDAPARSDGFTTFLSGLPEWVAKCKNNPRITESWLITCAGQTFEGGISARPDAEAHSAYAFCALACLCIIDDPHIVIPKYVRPNFVVSHLADVSADISMCHV